MIVLTSFNLPIFRRIRIRHEIFVTHLSPKNGGAGRTQTYVLGFASQLLFLLAYSAKVVPQIGFEPINAMLELATLPLSYWRISYILLAHPFRSK